MDPDSTDTARRLHDALEGAIVRALRRQDTIAIAVSGGLDSSVLAALAARHFDGTIQLINVSVPGAVDAGRARLLAEHLGLPLLEVVMNPTRLVAILPELVEDVGESGVEPDLAAEWGVPPTSRYVSPLRTAWEAPLFVAAREARRFAKRLIVGQGADELLAGYNRYARLPPGTFRGAMARDEQILDEEIVPLETRIANRHAIQLQYPFLDARVRALCHRLDEADLLHGEERKVVLRRVAKRLDLPEAVVHVPKTAAQYGSGIGALLAKLAQEAALAQNEYLTRLLRQRTIGEPQSLRT